MAAVPKIKDIVFLLRPWQWYKNLLVFVPLVFGLRLFSSDSFVFSVLAFVSLCLASSAGYAVNDVIDAKKDRLHPEKKARPVASGKVSENIALIVSVVLFISGFAIASAINSMLSAIVLALFFLTIAYSLFLKYEQILDVMAVSVNYVLRALGGVFAAGVPSSPWLVLCTFFLAFFLAVGKRVSEEGNGSKTSVRYSRELSEMMMTVSTSLLLLSYALYTFFSQFHGLFVTIPMAFYLVLRFAGLVHRGSAVGRRPHLAFRDSRLAMAMALWLVTTLAVLYL